MARHKHELDEDAYDNLLRLSLQLQEGQRIVQPRLRHRFQTDRHGLTRSTATLVRDAAGLRLVVDNEGSGFQLMVAAVYAAGGLAPTARRAVMDSVRKGMRWNGAGGDKALFTHLAGVSGSWDPATFAEPVEWALQILGLAVERNGSVHVPERSVIQKRFRMALRDAHPDHGGESEHAAQRIRDLTEARRILLG